MTRCVLVAAVSWATLISTASADEKAMVGVWRQFLRNTASVPWKPSGLCKVALDDHRLTMELVGFSSTDRGVIDPLRIGNVRLVGDTWTFRSDFGRFGVADFRLKEVDPSTFEGVVMLGRTRQFARFERIPDREALRGEVREIIRRIQVEIAVSERALNLIGRSLDDAKLREEAEMIRRTVGLPANHSTPNSLMIIFRTGDLGRERIRLEQLRTNLLVAEENLIRLQD